MASECAADQEGFWPYHELLFEQQAAARFSRDVALEIAAEIDLDLDAFATCYDTQAPADRLQKDQEDSVAQDVFATPRIYVNGEHVSALAVDALFEAIHRAAEEASS